MIEFRPLKREDFKQLHKWLNMDHVAKWWDKDLSYLAVVNKYSKRIEKDTSIHCYIIQYNKKDIGFIQYYLETNDVYDLDGLGVGIDLYIGDKDYLYHGIGPSAIQTLIHSKIMAHYHPHYICVDPNEDNYAAIKAYQKLGFKSRAIRQCTECKSHTNNYMVLRIEEVDKDD